MRSRLFASFAGPIVLVAVLVGLVPAAAQAGDAESGNTIVHVYTSSSYLFNGCGGGECGSRLIVTVVGDGLLPGQARADGIWTCITGCAGLTTSNTNAYCFWVLLHCSDGGETLMRWSASFPCALFKVVVDAVAENAIPAPNLQQGLVSIPLTRVSAGFEELVVVCSDGSVQFV